MRSHFSTCLACLCILTSHVAAQTTIFPGMTGDELVDALADTYAPAQLLTLSQAKDTLYAQIELRDDSVRCVYTNHAIYLPAGVDPSQTLYQDGAGINLEHVWPQSKGAGDGTPGRMDMHHLHPSRVEVNSNRSNKPFDEIPDKTTDKWFYKELALMALPDAQIELYSESVKTSFEPRESVKGDVARAMFYFYTMYEEQVQEAAPQFFEQQRETLCAWHILDPIDDAEVGRSQRVAAYQGNENPYVLDCTLAGRAYCGNEDECETVSLNNPLAVNQPTLRQNGCQFELGFDLASRSDVECSIVSTAGAIMLSRDTSIAAGAQSVDVDGCFLPAGIYILTAHYTADGDPQRWSTKVVIH